MHVAFTELSSDDYISGSCFTIVAEHGATRRRQIAVPIRPTINIRNDADSGASITLARGPFS